MQKYMGQIDKDEFYNSSVSKCWDKIALKSVKIKWKVDIGNWKCSD